jgi:acyl-coenzyme A thioesterase PaaI-like protein
MRTGLRATVSRAGLITGDTPPVATAEGSGGRPSFDDVRRQAGRTPVPPARLEMRRLAAAAREVIDRLVATRAPVEALTRAADQLEAASAELAGWPQGRLYEGFAEPANAGDPGAFFDHSPLQGAANPLAPPLRLEVVEGTVLGHVRFGAAYEGPPASVHGGYVAAAFDEALGMAQSLGGSPGMTGTLTIRYRRPTPLHTDLRIEATLDRQEGRKIWCSGRLLAGDELCAEAEGIFISVDLVRMAELRARRDGAAGEDGGED